jgi:hypothetical protein
MNSFQNSSLKEAVINYHLFLEQTSCESINAVERTKGKNRVTVMSEKRPRICQESML